MLKRAYFAQMHKKRQVSQKNLIDKNMGLTLGESFFDKTVQFESKHCQNRLFYTCT